MQGESRPEDLDEGFSSDSSDEKAVAAVRPGSLGSDAGEAGDDNAVGYC